MDTHFYYKALRNTIIQFLDIFNGIKVAKYDRNGTILKYVDVPVKLAPKEKSYMWAKDAKHEKALPLMAAQILSVNFDTERLTNPGEEVLIPITVASDVIDSYYNPTPYNIDFSVTIIGNYIVEIDQILEQILPWFTPQIFIKVKISELSNETFDIKVVFTGAQPNTPTELQESDYRILSWDLLFTVKTFLFRPLRDENSSNPLYAIKKMYREYYASQEAFDNRIMETTFTSGASGTYTYSSYTSAGFDENANTIINYTIFDETDVR